MFAEDAEIFLQAVEVTTQPAQRVENFLGALLDFHAAQAEQDRLQIGVETVRRNRDHMLFQGVAEKLALFPGRFFLDDRFVIDVLGGNVHQREVVRAFVG